MKKTNSFGESNALYGLFQVFRNPYNFGVWNNWRMLLGLVDGRLAQTNFVTHLYCHVKPGSPLYL